MNAFAQWPRCFQLIALLIVTGCSGGGKSPVVPPEQPPPAPVVGIGAAGGTVTGPNGAQVVIPAGALATTIDIEVALSADDAPALPSGFTAIGQMYAFTPHGTVFSAPVTLTLPFDPAAVPAGTTPLLYKTNALNEWQPVAGATFGADSVSAAVSSFSHAQVLIPKLIVNEPQRSWEFSISRGDDGPIEVLPEPDGQGTAPVGALLEKVADFGPAAIDATIFLPSGATRQPDGNASGMVMSTANGVTYGVFAEAPRGALGTSEPIEGATRFRQSQSFIKNADTAKLKFTLTSLFIEANDFSAGRIEEGLRLQGQASLSVKAYQSPGDDLISNRSGGVFFHAAGHASLSKQGGTFVAAAETDAEAKDSLWSLTSDEPEFEFVAQDAEFQQCVGRAFLLRLKNPVTYTIDLQAVELFEEFTVDTVASVASMNRQGRDIPEECVMSSVATWLRDPLDVGGVTVEFEGLEPTNHPLPPPPDEPVEPAACVPGPAPDPAAGLLQFGDAGFTVEEIQRSAPVIAITRTGGNQGAVTATLIASDGSAVGGSDYTPVNTTVFFGDGEAGQRLVSLEVLADQLDEENESLTLTLSNPGGCAALGPQTSALVTILDNDLPPPSGSVGLDPTFGTAGKATATAFGGDNSAMALQPDGKIVIVGGTFTDFILARFNADGTLDQSFDGDGKVTTDMVSGRQEEALGVAVQADGRIIVVGYTGTAGGGPTNFAIARYNRDGSLDTSFGSGGKVVSGVTGIARAVTLQPDGKILVVGDTPVSGQAGDFSDFALARYDTDGVLDASFGAGGRLTTDVGDGTNTARNVVVLANGGIVVSGEPIGVFAGSDHTDIVRYDANGVPDASFGTAGMVTLDGARVGEGLAVQTDGRLVLAGEVETAVPPRTQKQFSVRRLNANGTPDTTFGTAGVVNTAFTDRGDSARSVAVQADGKILVAGASSVQLNPQFAVARYNTDGTLDTAFGGAGGGRLTVDFFGFSDVAETVAVQADGKIVLGGLARDNVDGYGLARIVP